MRNVTKVTLNFCLLRKQTLNKKSKLAIEYTLWINTQNYSSEKIFCFPGFFCKIKSINDSNQPNDIQFYYFN